MDYKIIAEGFVSQQRPGTPTSACLGPRCAVTRGGELICVFGAQSALGINDFKPLLARSTDGGLTWSKARPIWPDEYHRRYSLCANLSATPSGDLLLFGFQLPVDRPGESYWSEANSGLKQNELVWSRSRDDGTTWEPLKVIPMPISGSAEAPGPMCATRDGKLVCCYSPYNTFDPNLNVEKNQVISLASRDGGRSWTHAAMLRFPRVDSLGAEAWVVELSDGRLLGTSWHVQKDTDAPNPFALSSDGGATWGPTHSTGIMGQTTALAPLPDGRVVLIYNQRKHGTVGVWMAIGRPREGDFGIIQNRVIWAAEISTRAPGKEGENDMEGWTSFAFGEPAPVILPDGTILVVLWVMQPSGYGIRYVKVKLV